MARAEPRISPLGDAAVVVTFGDRIDPDIHAHVVAFSRALESAPPPAMVEYVPAFATVTVLYDPLSCSYDDLAAALRARLGTIATPEKTSRSDPVEIPVCYGGDLGPDLDYVAAHNDLTTEDVVEIHTDPTYVVYMIGFVPGFPYLGGMSPRIAVPRLYTPRDAVPAGSVGIAGDQTGVYPIESPGGWRLIGRSPSRLFRPEAEVAGLLQAGDRVRFVPMTRADYDAARAREATS